MIFRSVGASVARSVPVTDHDSHCHDIHGNVGAKTLDAVRADVRQVQGTINGLGGHCGNADLMAIIPSLVLKMGVDCGIPADRLAQLTAVSRMLDERLNRPSDPHRAYVGAAARSEEHTSELQSLMRISYAVFCL